LVPSFKYSFLENDNFLFNLTIPWKAIFLSCFVFGKLSFVYGALLLLSFGFLSYSIFFVLF